MTERGEGREDIPEDDPADGMRTESLLKVEYVRQTKVVEETNV